VYFLVAHFSILGALSLMLVAGIRAALVPRDSTRCAWLVLISLMSILVSIPLTLALAGLAKFEPYRYDLYMAVIDRTFGYPNFLIGEYLSHHVLEASVVYTAYAAFYFVALLTISAYLWLRPMRDMWLVVRTFLINFCLSIPFYGLIPVSGPRYAFRGFPQLPEQFTLSTITLKAAPNGMPSIHTSTALLVVWFTWRWKWWGRTAGLAFLALTIIATLGTGEHYLIDLIAAVPYTALILRLGIGAGFGVKDEAEQSSLMVDTGTPSPSVCEVDLSTQFFRGGNPQL